MAAYSGKRYLTAQRQTCKIEVLCLLCEKIVLISIATVAVFAAALLVFRFLSTTDLPGQLRSMGYEVEIKDVTFRGYESQNISATKGEEKVKVQIVSNIDQNKADGILEGLTALILDANKDITIFDPYTAQEVTLSVPEEFKPLKRETTIYGRTVAYYLTHANIIFSLRVYSEPEVRYSGLFAAYFCENTKTAHKLEIYYPSEEKFDEENATNLLSSLYCSG